MNTRRCISRKVIWFLIGSLAWAAFATTIFRNDPLLAQDQPAAAAPAEETQRSSYFMYVVRASGIFGFVIFLMSMYMVAKVSRLFYEIRLPLAVPPDVLDRCQAMLDQRDFKSIFAVVKEDDSFFSRCLSTGIAELPNGLGEARESVERVGASITVEWEKKINTLAMLGTTAPLVGLLGTLQGMIGAFDIIGRSDTQVKVSDVAKNISTAMWTTLEGTVVAVPAIYFFTIFRDRVGVISSTAIMEADRFLRHFAHAARGGKGAAAPGPAAAK